MEPGATEETSLSARSQTDLVKSDGRMDRWLYLIRTNRPMRAKKVTYAELLKCLKDWIRNLTFVLNGFIQGYDDEKDGNESDSTLHFESDSNAVVIKVSKVKENKRSEMRMLDIYSGCGAISTGLCLGANMADVNLVTVVTKLTWIYLLM
ncbi:hypothetical protein L1987_12698 [Smallanthus sonchifolius]|uniref:Uncharacterized protein n=1 Tax=Smallanthus sonchifolius TaxID=185202 RepID=A0ACB9JHY3_9ASTR|nr:hypothetical protein L1987_12698 [Smallanthus sonchifolius]